MQLMQSHAANCYLLSVVGLVASLDGQPVARSQGVIFFKIRAAVCRLK